MSSPDASTPDMTSRNDSTTDEERLQDHKDRLELFAVLLIALTAVMTAWSAFEAT